MLNIERLEERTVLAAPVVLAVSNDTGFALDRVTTDNTLVIEGSANPGQPVSVFRNGSAIGTATANGIGKWRLDHSATALADGDYVFTASANGERSAPWRVTVRAKVEPILQTHHDRIPNFGHQRNAAGRRILVSTADGNWADQFRNAGPSDVVLVRNRIVVRGNINVRSIIVEAGAKLEFKTDANTELRVVNLQVLEGGSLEIGTIQKPVTGSVRILFRDVPLDLVRDPQQYGNGLIVLGSVRMHGRVLQETFARLAVEPKAGDRSLVLQTPVRDWRVGDWIALPDSRQGDFGAGLLDRQDERLSIAAISPDGLRITLASPLQFSHLGAHGGAGTIHLLPHVANLSRNVVLRSENAGGTRGHAILSDRADVDIRYVDFSGMGRTQNGPLDDTVLDSTGRATHVGTNQKGRYPLHLHHVYGSHVSPSGYQFTLVGNAISHSRKWPIAIHDSHYGLIKDNVVYGAFGAGIVTEDGSESCNRLESNFVAKINGDRDRGKFRSGTEGDGIWLAGPNNVLVDNVVASVIAAGYRVYGGENSDAVMVHIPAARGEAPHHDGIEVNLAELPVLQFAGNEAYSATMGMEMWYIGHKNYYDPIHGPMGESLIHDLKTWHTHRFAFFGDQQNHLTIDGMIALGDPAFLGDYDYPEGINLRNSKDVVIRRARVENFKIGLTAPQKVERLTREGLVPQGDVHPTLVERSYFDNVVDILVGEMDFDAAGELSPAGLTIDHTHLAGDTRVSLVYDQQPEAGLNIIQPFRVIVRALNGVEGANFQLFWAQQRPDFVVPVTDPRIGLTAAPVAGLTNAQLWATYGVAVFGQVMPPDARHGDDLRVDGYVVRLGLSGILPSSRVDLSGSRIADDLPIGALARTLSAVAGNANQAFTYTLVGGEGSDDNSSFRIVGNALRTKASFDYKTERAYSIRVRATDSTGLFSERQLTISVRNANDAPVLSAALTDQDGAVRITSHG